MTRIVETAVGRLGPTHRADRNIEILGVAGAGKSTLATQLAADPAFEMAPFIHARRPADLLLILRTIPRLLPILWELFPDHPNLLPAYFEPGRIPGDFVKKPLLSREGANITMVERGD